MHFKIQEQNKHMSHTGRHRPSQTSHMFSHVLRNTAPLFQHCPKLNLAPKRRVCQSIPSGQNAVVYNYNLVSSQTGEYEYQRHGGGGSGRPMYRSDSGVPYSLVGSHGRIRSASDGQSDSYVCLHSHNIW